MCHVSDMIEGHDHHHEPPAGIDSGYSFHESKNRLGANSSYSFSMIGIFSSTDYQPSWRRISCRWAREMGSVVSWIYTWWSFICCTLSRLMVKLRWIRANRLGG